MIPAVWKLPADDGSEMREEVMLDGACSALGSEIGPFYPLTKSADFCMKHGRFLLGDFIGRFYRLYV